MRKGKEVEFPLKIRNGQLASREANEKTITRSQKHIIITGTLIQENIHTDQWCMQMLVKRFHLQ